MSFSATLEAVIRARAYPIIVDVERNTGMMSSLSVMNAVIQCYERHAPVAAVVMVHLYGWPAPDIAVMKNMCAAQGLMLIEDCAQAFGARKFGHSVGTYGDAAAFSFYPTKPLGGIGDGGAAYFSDKSVADKARARRNHGRTQGGQVYPGYNSRMDETNAAVLRDRLSRYGGSLTRRRELDSRYNERLKSISLDRNGSGAPYVYPVLVDQREAVQRRLNDIGVETRVHYDPALSDLPYAQSYDPYMNGGCPNSTWLSKRQLSLPCHTLMCQSDVDRICDAVIRS